MSFSSGSDEFGTLRYEENPSRTYRVGDKVELIVSHCDPVVNLYDSLYAVRGERAAPLLREQEGGGEAQRLDIVRVLREDALRRLDGLLPVARRHQHEELLDERREEPRVQHDHLVELLERLLWRDLLSLVLGIECIEPASWNGGTLSGQQCVV